MTHQWHDTYRHASTPAHHLDPRSKLFVGLLYIGTVLCTARFNRLQGIGYPLVILAAILLAGIPWKPLIRRTLSILPFALLIFVSAAFSQLSQEQFLTVVTRALLSILALTTFSLATPFPDVLRALRQLRAPKILLLFLAFLYRYTAVLGKQIVQLERGWRARYFGRRWTLQWARLGHVLASLLVRSYERAERVYAAMLARGFSAGSLRIPLLHFTASDFIFVGASVGILGFLRWGHL